MVTHVHVCFCALAFAIEGTCVHVYVLLVNIAAPVVQLIVLFNVSDNCLMHCDYLFSRL